MSNQIDLIYAKSVEEQLGRILPQLEAHHKKIIDISKTQIDFFGGKTAKSPADLGKVETQYKKIVDSIEKTRLAEIKLQKAREKAFDDYQKTIDKKAQAEQKSAEKAIRESERIIKQKEKEFAKFERDFNKYEADLAKQAIAEQKAKKAKVQAILDESKAIQSLQRQKEKAIADEAKEQAKLKASENLYNRVQQKLNALSNEYKALATKKELGLTLTDKENQKYTSLQGRIQKYDATLKAVDATVGKHQRNVGNYASAFNPLSNSINQLTREMPAFTYSVQTGFMALSNNIPIFTDAISNAIKQNKILQAEGKPTTSVLSQLAGAFLSWQTLMGVGITLLTVYGKEIGDFLSKAFKGSSALDAMKESQSQLNDITKEGAKNAVEETLKLKSLLEIAKDTSLSYKERKIAVDELQSTYPAYFGNLTQEQILAGQTTEAENALTEAILSRAKANAAVAKITENQAKVIDLDEQEYNLKVKLRNVTAETRTLEELQRNGKLKNANALLINYRKEKDLANEIKEVQKEANHYDEINNRLTNYALENQKKAILLDDKEVKGKEKKIEQLKETEKYQTNSQKAFEANISALENELSTIDRMNPAYDTLNGLLQLQKTIYDQLFKSKEKNSEQDVIDLENLGKLAKGMLDFALYGKKATEQLDLFGKAGEGAMAGFEKYQKSIDDYLKTFQSEFFSNAGLPTLFKILNDEIVGFGTNFAVTFNSIVEVAQEAFQYIQQASNANFQNEFRNLETQYNVARKFAGDNADAQAEIDRQMEIRRREIRRREFKAQQKIALFNIAIDTAQAVVSSIAESPATFGLPFSAFALAMGALQAGVVLSQSVPEYWKGTDDHIGGLMKVNDQKGGNYQEAVVLPNKKVILPQGRDVIMNAPRGTKVYNADKTREMLDSMMFNDQLNNILSSNGIGSPIVNNRLNDERIVDALNSVEMAIANKSYEGVKLDENGIKKYISNGQTTTYLTNARRTFTPRNT